MSVPGSRVGASPSATFWGRYWDSSCGGSAVPLHRPGSASGGNLGLLTPSVYPPSLTTPTAVPRTTDPLLGGMRRAQPLSPPRLLT